MTSAEGYGLTLVGDRAEPAAATRDSATDSISVEALVPAYSALLFRVAYAVLRNRAEAEDAVQDTFVRVLAHRATLPEVRDMRVWLVRIVWRLALDRRARITPSQVDAAFVQTIVAGDVPADEALATARELTQVLAEIDRLPKGERHVLLLSALDEMKTSEIAGVLGRSESAVRALLFRARERLRARLDKAYGGRS